MSAEEPGDGLPSRPIPPLQRSPLAATRTSWAISCGALVETLCILVRTGCLVSSAPLLTTAKPPTDRARRDHTFEPR